MSPNLFKVKRSFKSHQNEHDSDKEAKKKKAKHFFPSKSSLLNAQQKKNNKAREAKEVGIRENKKKKSGLLCYF